MPPPKQKALLLPSKFGKLTVQTVDVPKPNPGEILIKIQATALNNIDWKIHKYGFIVNHFPAVLGSDIAGDVVEVGKGVTSVSVGDRIFFQAKLTKESGSFQQYAIAKPPHSRFIGKIPDNLTYKDASTFPLTLLTAYLGLFNKNPSGLALPNPLADGGGKSAGQLIVVLGGSTSVGQFVLQLARLAGFSTIITTASLTHTDWLTSLGATHVIDRHIPTPALSAEISKIIKGQALKSVFDAVSLPETQQLGYDLLAPGGQIAIVLSDEIKNKVGGKGIVNVSGQVGPAANNDALDVLFKNITPLLEDGTIEPLRVEVLPRGLASIPDGLQRLENGQVSGFKLVARPQETP